MKDSGTLGNDTPWADKLGLPNPFGVTGWPTICGAYPFLYYGCWDGDNRKDENLTSYQIDENITWIKGKHSMQFGTKLRQEYNNIRELQQAQGSHGFYSDWTSQWDPANEIGGALHGLRAGQHVCWARRRNCATRPTAASSTSSSSSWASTSTTVGRSAPRLTLDIGRAL